MQLLHPFSDAFEESLAVQGAASGLGFDWPDTTGVLAKVEEEVQEIREALAAGDVEHARRELGDLLLIVVNLARFLDTHPGQALHEATRRFQDRFEGVKEMLRQQGKRVQDCTLDELDEAWAHVKSVTSQGLEEGLDTQAANESHSKFVAGGNSQFSL